MGGLKINSQRFLLLLIAALLSITANAFAQDVPVYRDPKAPLEQRVNDLFNRMTPLERLSLLGATGLAQSTQPIPRLGVPALMMAEAGQGDGGGSPSTEGPATAFPSGVNMGATWDPELISRIGHAIGVEALNKNGGAQLILGPAVNIHRTPLGGRSGEYCSEDPYLTSRIAVAYIQGMQQTGCAACIKHYACNNQEFERTSIDVQVDESALREIYTPAFIAAVREGKVWTVMSAYNKINGSFASANWYLQKQILKKEAGFDGILMTDWGGLHSTLAVNDGCDLENPGAALMAPGPLTKAIQAGDIQQSAIDDAARRVIRTIIRVGLLDGLPHQPDHTLVNSPEHQRLAFEAAAKSIILLKNCGSVLPLDPRKIHSIALIGPTAKGWQIGAAGSPWVTPFYSVSPYEGITRRASKSMAVRYDRGVVEWDTVPASVLTPAGGSGQGLLGEYFKGRELAGPPIATRVDAGISFLWDPGLRPPGVPEYDFSVRWTGTLTAPVTGRYRFAVNADDGCRLFIDGKKLIDFWRTTNGGAPPASVDLVAGHVYNIRIEYFQAGGGAHTYFSWMLPNQRPFVDAVEIARKSDVAIVCVGSGGESGSYDRPSMALPGMQNDLIKAIAAVNKNTIVVLNNGGPVLLKEWLDQVPAVIEAGFPGQEGGAALAAILFGDVNPSAKLTDTVGNRREDYPDFDNYPGTNGKVHYAEGIYVGYRHFDKDNLGVSFPFGHGLSYTQFRYRHLKLSPPVLSPTGMVTVTADITNTGQRAGAEVVQLYVRDKDPKIDRPMRELKGFAKTYLEPGQTRTVTMTIAPQALAYCDVPGKQWKADAGVYAVELGSSSRDLRAQADLTLNADYTLAIPGMGAKSPFAQLEQARLSKAPKAKSFLDPPEIPSAVQIIRDLKYGEAPDYANLLDIYLPKKAEGAMPLVIWIHGGCWAGGDKPDPFVVNRMVCRMVPRGYVIASINYRLLHEAIFPAQIYDCKGAVRWLRAHAAQYHIDPNRVGVAGLSAGGHLVALLGTSGGVKDLEGTVGGNLDQSSSVQAVCDDCGPTDFIKYFEQAAPNNIFIKNPDKSCIAVLVGGPLASHKAMVARANPITYVSANDPPFLILQGKNDSYVPWQQSQILADALNAAHVECRLVYVPGEHGIGEMSPVTLNARDEFFDHYLHPARPVKPAKP